MPDRNLAFTQILSESLPSKVTRALKEAFFAGTLRAGDVIVERRLAKEMGVGTPAIREALVTLEEQGFIRRVANTGTYVNKFNPEEVEQMFLVRTEFEVLAFQWAKRRVDGRQLGALESLVEKMEAAAAQKNTRQFYEYDLEFHRRCWALCGNKYLCRALEAILAPLFACVLNESRDAVQVPIAREHYNLINALRRLEEPEFTAAVRRSLTVFALRGMKSIVHNSAKGETA